MSLSYRPVSAYWPIRPLMQWIGIGGLPMPWGVCYILPDCMDHPILLRHEEIHYEQMRRDGHVTWTLKWFWWTLTRGYRRNPYEVEAYRRQYEGDMIPLDEVIADPDALAHAEKQFRDADPGYNGHVTLKWIASCYYGAIRAWCLKSSDKTAYLVSPLACHPPYHEPPRDNQQQRSPASTAALTQITT